MSWDPPRRWPNTRRSAYRYLPLAAHQGRIALDPGVALACAREVADKVTDDWLHETWLPVVSRWPLARLRRTAGSRSLSTAAEVATAVERVLTALAMRKEGLEAEFRWLYGQRPGNLGSEEETP